MLGNAFRRENVTSEITRHGLPGCFFDCNDDGDLRLDDSAHAVRRIKGRDGRFETVELLLMNRRAPHGKKVSRRPEERGRSGLAEKVPIAKSPNRFEKEKDEPIKCASPPCYLSEIED